MRHDEPDGMRGIGPPPVGASIGGRGGVPCGGSGPRVADPMGLLGPALLVEASAMMDFMSTFGADVIVFQPLTGLAGDSLPLGTRAGIPGAATGAAAVPATGASGSSIMNTSSSGIPVAAGRELSVGRSSGLLGTDTFDCLLPRLVGPGGDSFGESLNALGRNEGTMGCGISWRASQSPHVSIALSTIRVERDKGYFLACSARTKAESCLMRSGARSSSMRPSRKTSMLIAK